MMGFLISQRRAIQLLFILVLIAGFISLNGLGREELPDPSDESDGLTISAILPGASPEEVDRRIARPLHSALKSIAGVKDVDSNASEGSLFLRVRFKSGEQNLAAISQEVSQRVNQITDLPADIEGPFVSQFKSRLWEDMSMAFVGGNESRRISQ